MIDIDRIDFRKLNWPSKMNTNILAELLDKETFYQLISERAKLSRKSRRIMLPSQSCFKKILSHFLWGKVVEKKESWDSIKRALIHRFGSLKAIGLSRTIIEKFYKQREAEILKELLGRK
jgi:hypothetical protein